MQLLAEIFTGERDWSDIFLLIAVVLFAVAFLGNWQDDLRKMSATLMALGLAFTAFALMLL